MGTPQVVSQTKSRSQSGENLTNDTKITIGPFAFLPTRPVRRIQFPAGGEGNTEGFMIDNCHVVLIVDDDKDVLNSLARTFEMQKFVVIKAKDPDEAVQNMSPEVDIVITDYDFGSKTASHMIAHFQAEYQKPQILITALKTAVPPETSDRVNDLFAKPFRNMNLVERVRQILHMALGEDLIVIPV
jgi:CheY-like chemotaxis protein